MSPRGLSNCNLPCSTSCMAATDVMALLIEAIQNTESAVNAALSAALQWPNAAAYVVPSLSATMATTPGRSPASTACWNKRSSSGLPPGSLLLSCCAVESPVMMSPPEWVRPWILVFRIRFTVQRDACCDAEGENARPVAGCEGKDGAMRQV